jgi:hypothetical protein
MVYFQTKNPICIKFGGSCYGRCWYIYSHLAYFMAVWYMLLPFGIFYGIFGGHLIYFSHFGKLYQEKSGNPGI